MRRCNTWLAVMACWLAMAPVAKGQSVLNRMLYDRSKDEATQKAAENGKKISSGSIFESELKNVETFAKLEIDSIFSGRRARFATMWP